MKSDETIANGLEAYMQSFDIVAFSVNVDLSTRTLFSATSAYTVAITHLRPQNERSSDRRISLLQVLVDVLV